MNQIKSRGRDIMTTANYPSSSAKPAYHREQTYLEELSNRIFEVEQDHIDNDTKLARAKERWEAKKADIKQEVAFDAALTNDARRRAKEKELLTAPENIDLERAVEMLDRQGRLYEIQIESLKRLFTIRLVRFKSLLLTTPTLEQDV